MPIDNMTTPQVREALLSSKAYIDFGCHPGKDHLPREAVSCGCCIITGKKGSAAYYEDVPIPDEFKFDDKDEHIDAILERIRSCFRNYDEEQKKFEYYREYVRNEENAFEEGIKRIFVKT